MELLNTKFSGFAGSQCKRIMCKSGTCWHMFLFLPTGEAQSPLTTSFVVSRWLLKLSISGYAVDYLDPNKLLTICLKIIYMFCHCFISRIRPFS
jgi:hypothetical protein